MGSLKQRCVPILSGGQCLKMGLALKEVKKNILRKSSKSEIIEKKIYKTDLRKCIKNSVFYLKKSAITKIDLFLL